MNHHWMYSHLFRIFTYIRVIKQSDINKKRWNYKQAPVQVVCRRCDRRAYTMLI